MNILLIILIAFILFVLLLFILGIAKIGIRNALKVFLGITGMVLIVLGAYLISTLMWRTIGIIMLLFGICFEVVMCLLYQDEESV